MIASVNIENKPHLCLANSVILLGRSLAVICVSNNLESDQSGQIYNIELSQYLNETHPNLCVIPMIHNVDMHKTENVPLVVVNLSTEDIHLSERRSYGFYAKSIFRYFRDNH